MICQKCSKETVTGKFCQFCGAKLEAADEVAASAEQKGEPIVLEEVVVEEELSEETAATELVATEEEVVQEPNKFGELLKEESSKLGTFLLTHIKKPRDAANTSGNYLVSGIVMMVVLSLVITLHEYLAFLSYHSGFKDFIDYFIIPFLKHILAFGVLAAIVFGSAKAVLQEITIKDAIAKYGAYLVPFTLLYIVGIILGLVELFDLAAVVITVSVFGIIMLIPTLVLTEQEVKGFDLIYAITGVTIISYLVFSYITTGSLVTL